MFAKYLVKNKRHIINVNLFYVEHSPLNCLKRRKRASLVRKTVLINKKCHCWVYYQFPHVYSNLFAHDVIVVNRSLVYMVNASTAKP